MIKIKKSALSAGIRIISHEDWRQGTYVREKLNDDSFGKCYICEDKPEDMNKMEVEHVRSRHKHPKLSYVWGNLLLSCKHCNSVKGSDFDEIINPADENGLNPEEFISFHSVNSDRVEITASCDEDEATVLETVRLLNAVFNYKGASEKSKRGSTSLRGKLNKEMVLFETYIDHVDKPGYAELIKDSIDCGASFAAFKRQMIRDDANLYARFGTSLT